MDNFSNKVQVFLDYFIHHDGYKTVLLGLRNTAEIAMLGLLIGIVFGTVIATTRVIPRTNPVAKFFNGLSGLYVGLFRGTPHCGTAAGILLCADATDEPAHELRGRSRGGLRYELRRLYLRDHARRYSVRRQWADGGRRAIGLSYATTMMKIVIPQAVKNILPTLGNEFISLIKETSVVSFVGAMDLYVAFNRIGSNSYEFMIPYLVMALIYIVIVLVITLGIKLMERSLRKSDKSI